MRQLLCVFGAITLVAPSLPAYAQEQPYQGGIWYLWRTDEGCLFYQAAGWTAAQAAEIRRTWFHSLTWEGSPCTPGKLINGTGALVEVQNLKVTAGKAGRGINRRAGTMVNGVWNGLVTLSDEYPDGSKTYPPQYHAMGCVKSAFRPPPCNSPRSRVELLGAGNPAPGPVNASSSSTEVIPAPATGTPPGADSETKLAPVTPGGAPCEKVQKVNEETDIGTTGYTRYTYTLSNSANCGRIGLTPKAGDVTYLERILDPGEIQQFLCFKGVSHQPNCGEGLTGYSLRLLN